MGFDAPTGSLLAVSDLRVGHAENRVVFDRLRPTSDFDWMIVAGDVGEKFADIERALKDLRSRFRQVIWTPGNHELWTPPGDPVTLRGVARYAAIVDMCRRNGVITPEDEYQIFAGPAGPVAVVSIFQLYDDTWRVASADTKEESLRRAYAAGVVRTGEMYPYPYPYPYPSREAWCADRVAQTARRLSALDPALPTVLVSHWPLVRQPTATLWYPEFAQWTGTVATADWNTRYRAVAAVYGQLHVPRSTQYAGVLFEEVSLGYPREWSKRGAAPDPVRQILGPAR